MAAPIKKHHLPRGRQYGRPGYKLKDPFSCTVHNTGNEKAGADAEAHDRFLHGGQGVSWHASSDHDSIIEHMPLDEQAWHAGTNAGNTSSLGIEICEYPKTKAGRAKQKIATNNGAWWIALQHHKRGIRPTRATVRTHKSWSGKNCPRDILPHWDAFFALVLKHYDAMQPARKPAKPPKKLTPPKSPPTVRRGDKGSTVRKLQRALRKAGYRLPASTSRLGVVDGVYGAEVERAVRSLQKRKGLVQDGVVGPKTWTALGY